MKFRLRRRKPAPLEEVLQPYTLHAMRTYPRPTGVPTDERILSEVVDLLVQDIVALVQQHVEVTIYDQGKGDILLQASIKVARA